MMSPMQPGPMGPMAGGHVEVMSPHGGGGHMGGGGHHGPPGTAGHMGPGQQQHPMVALNGHHGHGTPGGPQGQQQQNGAAPGQPPQGPSGPPQVSLSLLIEFIVQRTYHDLTVLAELLPRKTDMERKIEIFNFASRTRMIMIRLLALVKWASSASKVDKCVSIMNFCERSANVFMEAADQMAKMARETLVRATLPNFHLPAAVEVLTSGSYNRIPRCIRDRIVPTEPITAADRRRVLLQLNQVIEQRLVSTDIPPRMRNLRIANGRVTFRVEHEFEASLTLMGDGTAVPWRLLRVSVLVEDKETGEGKALMHSLQVRYVEQLVQARLAENLPNALHDMYDLLHSLCQSLQLEVLHAQTLRLCHERLGDHIRVEEYLPGRCLTLSYWRELSSHTGQPGPPRQGAAAAALALVDPSAELGFRFSVQVDPHDPSQPLMVWHVPALQPASDASLVERAVRCSERISMERLLVHTIHVRTRHKLGELKREVERRLSLGDVEATLHGSPALLSVPILQPCLRSEQLMVSVDTHTGVFLAHVPQYESNPVAPEIQQTLNDDKSKLESLVSQLRHWITKQRVHKTLLQLPATSYEMLPVLFDLSKHPLKDLSPNRMYIRLHRHPDAVLIVEFHERASNHCEMDYQYYFLWVKPASIEDNPNDESVVTDVPKVYLKALSMVEFDPFLITHGSGTQVDVQDLSEKIIGKRKSGGKVETPIKRTKFPAYFISDLSHAVSFADERLPFALLASELTRRGVANSGVEVEAPAKARTGLVVRVVRFPRVPEVPPAPAGKVQVQEAAASKVDVAKGLRRFLLNASVRLVNRNGRFWKVEFTFCGNPVRTATTGSGGENGSAKRASSKRISTLHFTYEIGNTSESTAAAVTDIAREWTKMAHLFRLVAGLEDRLRSSSSSFESDYVSIRRFDFKEATLEYGPGRKQLLRVRWSAEESRFRMAFGGVDELSGMCPHSVLREKLEHHLNLHRDLALTCKILHETFGPVKSICRLPTTPQMGMSVKGVNSPVETFVVLPQSSTHIKVIFYGTYCLDVQIKAGGLVFVRDGAISHFDQRKALEEVQPIPGLKTFLMKYVDENALQRRQSQTEDDHPPSPMAVGGGGDGSGGGGGAGESGASGLKFHAPQTPPSNPLTPASPHASSGQQQHQQLLQSPPSSVRQPSPANIPQPSPQQPSPAAAGAGGTFTAPSPASNPIGSVGSPFPPQSPMGAAGSPAPRQHQTGLSPAPGGGGGGGTAHASRPSARILPQRLWAGANPTPLTHQAFDEICRPGQQQQQQQQQGMAVTPATSAALAPIHRFLGSLFLRRQLHHMIRSEEEVQAVPSPDPTTIAFKTLTPTGADLGLTCRISFHPSTSQTLHCKLEPGQNMMNHWNPEMLMILEKYFDTRVAVPPFRPNTMVAFVRILQCPIEPLKDIINLIRLELQPELAERQGLKWTCRICLTVPPAAPNIMPLGQPGLLKLKEKMLLFLHIIRTNVKLPPGQEPMSVVIPLVYDMLQNQTTVAQKVVTPVISISSQQLTRLARSGQLNMQRCTILPSVQELLYNLSLPNEGPPHQMVPQQQPQMMQMQPMAPQQMMGPGGMAPGMRPQMRPQMGPGGPGGPGGVVRPDMMQNPMQRQQ